MRYFIKIIEEPDKFDKKVSQHHTENMFQVVSHIQGDGSLDQTGWWIDYIAKYHFLLDWPVSLPQVRRASDLTQIGYSLVGQANFLPL